MKGVLRIVLMSLLMLPLAVSAGKIYKVIDKNGRVIYTDTPPAGDRDATTIELPDLNTQSTSVSERRKPARPEDQEKPKPFRYESIAIQTPTNEQTIPPGQREVALELALTPELLAGHRVQVLFDGAPWGDPVAATRFMLHDLERGEHTVQAEVVDGNDELVGRSQPVTIYVKRSTVADNLPPSPDQSDGEGNDASQPNRPRGFSNGTESPFKFKPRLPKKNNLP